MVLDALPLVAALAAQMSKYRFPISFDELRSVGHLALVRAAASYDPSYQMAFSVWAYHSVRGAMLNAVRDGNGTVTRKENSYIAHVGEGDFQRVTFSTETRRARGEETRQARGKWTSKLDEDEFSESAPGSSDAIPEDLIDEKRRYTRLAEILPTLPERQREIVELYLRHGSFAAIAKALQITRPSVFRTYSRALAHFRQRWSVERLSFAG